MEIEHASFPIPWTKDAMAQEIRGREWSRVLVSTSRESVTGFMVYWNVVSELHLLNLAVHPDYRRRGAGRAMVQHLMDMMDIENIASAILEVRVSNRAAQRLYRSFGFTPIAMRVNYYTDNGEDAIVMGLRRR
jgi:ribosomal-protein-alanine N-acetyltransferase